MYFIVRKKLKVSYFLCKEHLKERTKARLIFLFSLIIILGLGAVGVLMVGFFDGEMFALLLITSFVLLTLWLVVAAMMNGDIKVVKMVQQMPDTQTAGSRKTTLFYLEGVGEGFLRVAGITPIDNVDASLAHADRPRQQNAPRGKPILLRHRAEESGDTPLPQQEDLATDGDQNLQDRGIDQDIENVDAYLAHADRLRQQGDPRGEFILLCHRAEESGDTPLPRREDFAADRDRYLQDWGRELLGDLLAPYQRGAIELSWRLGFVDRLRIKPGADAQAILSSLPSQACCRYLRCLDLSHSGVSTLPDELGRCAQVRELDIRSCPLERANIYPPWQHLMRVRASEALFLKAFDGVEGSPLSWDGADGLLRLLVRYYQTVVEDLSDDQLQASLDGVEQDQERYLVNLSDWSPAFCVAQAREDALDLSDSHWLIIAFLRVYYDLYQIAPAIRVLTKAFGRILGPDKGNSEYLYELFPYGLDKQATRYAGLPKPTC